MIALACAAMTGPLLASAAIGLRDYVSSSGGPDEDGFSLDGDGVFVSPHEIVVTGTRPPSPPPSNPPPSWDFGWGDNCGGSDSGCGSGSGGGSEDPPPQEQLSCGNNLSVSKYTANGITYLRFSGNIQFIAGDRNQVTGLPELADRQITAFERSYYTANLGWNGQVGSFDVTTELQEGPGGLTVYVGSDGGAFASNYLGTGIFYLPAIQEGDPGLRSWVKNVVLPHEFGHSLRIDHNLPGSSLMRQWPDPSLAALSEADIRAGMLHCR